MATVVKGHFLRVKQLEREIDHLALSNAKFKNKRSYTHLPPYAFIL
jgi:hypothetical protein